MTKLRTGYAHGIACWFSVISRMGKVRILNSMCVRILKLVNLIVALLQDQTFDAEKLIALVSWQDSCVFTSRRTQP